MTLGFIQANERMVGQNGAYADTLNRALRNLLLTSGYNPDAATFAGMPGPVVNAVAYGADPSGVTDSTAAIQAMFDAMGTLYPKGAIGVIPLGDYKITAPLTPPGVNAFVDSSKHTIRMHGARLFFYDATPGRSLLKLNAFINTEGLLTIEGGTLDGANATSTSNGVEIHSGNVKLDRMVIRSFTGGYGVTYVNDLAAPPICTEIASCYIQNNRIGVNATVAASLLYIHGGRIEHNKEENIYLDNCGKICFIGVTVENSGDTIASKSNLYIRNGVDGLISGCYFESSAYQGHSNVKMEGVSGAPTGLVFTGNRLVGYYETAFGSGVALTSAIGLDIAPGTGAVESVVAYGNYYAGMYMAVRIGTNARGYDIGPDNFSDNFAPSFVTPACVRYSMVSANPGRVSDLNRYASTIYSIGATYAALAATTVNASGLITAGAGVSLGAALQGQGKAYTDAALGTVLQGKTGTNYDLALLTPGAASVAQVPTGTPDWSMFGNAKIGVVGKGLYVKEGSNATMGRAVLVAGSVVVSTTKVTALSEIFLMGNVDGGTPGWHRVSARTAGTSFTITSSSGTDTSQVSWLIVEPA